MTTEVAADVEMLDAAVLLDVLTAVEAGDFTARMPVHWIGSAGKVADALNEIIAANQALRTELSRLSRIVTGDAPISSDGVVLADGTSSTHPPPPIEELKLDSMTPALTRGKSNDTLAVATRTTVLVVDDHFPNVFALTALLERANMNVIAAQSGGEALATLERDDTIDVVLMDIMMPVMDGYQTMTAIRARKQYADLPIIAVTGKVVGKERERCIAAGASDYIPKPVDTASLLAVLSAWVPAVATIHSRDA